MRATAIGRRWTGSAELEVQPMGMHSSEDVISCALHLGRQSSQITVSLKLKSASSGQAHMNQCRAESVTQSGRVSDLTSWPARAMRLSWSATSARLHAAELVHERLRTKRLFVQSPRFATWTPCARPGPCPKSARETWDSRSAATPTTLAS